MTVGGFIPVDRRTRNAGESFRAASERLRRGGSVLLFPEETRSADGRLLPFQRGGFLLALRSGLPIVPVGLRGTMAVQTPKSFRIHPGRVLVRYGAPLDPGASGAASRLARWRRCARASPISPVSRSRRAVRPRPSPRRKPRRRRTPPPWVVT